MMLLTLFIVQGPYILYGRYILLTKCSNQEEKVSCTFVLFS